METPPLTRRKLFLDKCTFTKIRNTSAHAEKTAWTLRDGPGPRKHLRSRGENRVSDVVVTSLIETPPLTRRKQSVANLANKSYRNTSAHAEKTVFYVAFNVTPKKHLRSRGENSSSSANSIFSLETPPLTRRKRNYYIEMGGVNGNTSAHAEKTPR